MGMLRLRASVGLQLCLAFGSAAAIAGAPACDPCHGGWSTRPYELPTALDEATLRDAISVFSADGVTSWIVGDHGVLARIDGYDVPTNLPRPISTDLRGIVVSDDQLVVVGLGGTLVVGDLEGIHWTPIDLGTTADLFHVTSLRTRTGTVLVAVGDDVMYTRATPPGAWRPVPAPEGGWGRLRGTGVDIDGSVFAIGLGGVLWSAPDLAGPWTRIELGITADLTTLGPPGSDALLIGGSDGTLLGRDSDGWRPLVPPFTGDVADISSRYILTAPGEIYSYEFHPLTLSKVAAPGLGLYTLSEAVSDGVVALGKPGRQVRVSEACGSTSGL